MRYYLIFLIFISSCSSYRNVDTLYRDGEFLQAYETLLKIENSQDLKFKERELKLIVNLVIIGYVEYLPILDSLLLAPPPEGMKDWHAFIKSWLRYMSASNKKDFQNILNILPSTKFNDHHIEPLRLIILAYSLVELERYDELITTFNANNTAKKNSDLLYLQGIAHLRLKNQEIAYNYFRQTLKLTANNKLKSLAHFYIAEIHENSNEDELALANYIYSWEFDPNNAETNYRIGKELQKKSYTSLHHRFFRAALRINDDLAAAWYSLNIQ